MKKAEAEQLIIQLWREWPKRDAPTSPMKGMSFYNWLASERPYALMFTTPVTDKWQIVSSLLSRNNLI